MRRALLALALAACTHRAMLGDDQGGDPADAPPPPKTGVVPAIGSAATLEIATWNIQNFPDSSATPGMVADLITSLDLDIVVTEEIANEAAWAQLLEILAADYDGVLSTHVYSPTEYQKIGVIYRRSLVSVGEPQLLFENQGYPFPRPPFALPITVDNDTYELVGVHLKAGTNDDDIVRRTQAIVALDDYLRAQIDGGGQDHVIVLGDYNQRILTDDQRAVFAPLLDKGRYVIHTEQLALAGEQSYLGFGGELIDHITTTAPLDVLPKWAVARVEIPALDTAVPDYKNQVSDHLPVVLVVPR